MSLRSRRSREGPATGATVATMPLESTARATPSWANVIHAAHVAGALEATNAPYAIAKIAGIK